MVDVTKLSKEERDFVTGIINRLDSGDVQTVGTELLAEFTSALTPEIMQRGYRLGDVLCEADLAQVFNHALTQENKTPLHMICVGYAMAKELR
jgi:membrane protease subunit (stomatin/prohibitin family)